jgi:hypothetical protein
MVLQYARQRCYIADEAGRALFSICGRGQYALLAHSEVVYGTSNSALSACDTFVLFVRSLSHIDARASPHVCVKNFSHNTLFLSLHRKDKSVVPSEEN